MHFYIRSREEADRFATDLCGRAENLRDDYLGASPDHEDITNAENLLDELTSFPAVVGPLSGGESEMLLQTIENVRDIDSLGGGTWRIRSEKGLTLLSVHVGMLLDNIVESINNYVLDPEEVSGERDTLQAVNADLEAMLKASDSESFPLCVEFGGDAAKVIDSACSEAKCVDCLQAIACGGMIN